MIGFNRQKLIVLLFITLLWFNISAQSKKTVLMHDEINMILQDTTSVKNFIINNFDSINSSNPSFIVYKKNFKLKIKSKIFFCEIPVTNVFAYFKDSSYAFYIELTDFVNLEKQLGKFYGLYDYEAEIGGNIFINKTKLFCWNKDKTKIYLKKYRKVDIAGNDFYIVIVGNVSLKELT